MVQESSWRGHQWQSSGRESARIFSINHSRCGKQKPSQSRGEMHLEKMLFKKTALKVVGTY